MTRKFWIHWALWFGGYLTGCAAVLGTIWAFRENIALGLGFLTVGVLAAVSAAMATVTSK